MATNPSVKVYGFVSDTAFYNKDFTNPGTTNTVDQGACCLTDKVASMFGKVGIIKDTRTARAPTTQLNDVSVWTDAPDALKNSDGVLDGSMSIVFDINKVSSDVRSLFSSETNKNVMQNLFNLIEYVAYYQKMINEQERIAVAVSALAETTAFAEIAAAAGHAAVDAQETEIDCFTTVNTVYAKDNQGVIAHLRFVRDKFTVTFDIKDDSNNTVGVELHLWLGRDMFLGSKSIAEGGYPLSTITDVVLPCPADKLYTLLDTYGSVSEFASASSEGKNSVYHITDYEYEDGALINVHGEYNINDATLNAVVKSDDHTGVYTFTTNYYGYPDTQPNNTFTLSFKVVYKGARPSLDDIKTALRRAILDIIPAHTEDEWRKKLPGIISERWFFLIPLYDNIWKKDGVEHRYGIVDTTQSRLTALVSRVLGSSYASGSQSVVPYAQVIIPKYSKFPVIVVPKMDNPSNSKLFTNIYQDYIGINATSQDASDDLSGDHLTDESDLTQSFTEAFNAALAKAYNKNLPHGSITDFNGLFEMFTPQDGITYCILSRNTYEEYFG